MEHPAEFSAKHPNGSEDNPFHKSIARYPKESLPASSNSLVVRRKPVRSITGLPVRPPLRGVDLERGHYPLRNPWAYGCQTPRSGQRSGGIQPSSKDVQAVR